MIFAVNYQGRQIKNDKTVWNSTRISNNMDTKY
jgi:hypothetical protein